MKFDELCDAVVLRFENAITSAGGLSNLPPGDAYLLGSAMVCYQMQRIEAALQDLSAAVGGAGQPVPSEPPGDMLRAADQMARGVRTPEPLVRVDAIPPGDGPSGSK